MRPSELLKKHRDEIVKIILSNEAANPKVFGSVLHGTDTEDSDLDILIENTGKTSLMDVAKITVQLEDLLGIDVDVVTKNSLHESFRDKVANEAVTI